MITILPDLDDDPATVTFATDRFSAYAVIYGAKGSFDMYKTSDMKAPNVSSGGSVDEADAVKTDEKTSESTSESTNTSPKTGDSFPAGLPAALLVSVLALVCSLKSAGKQNN